MAAATTRPALRHPQRPGIVGLGEACAICAREMAAETERLGGLRDRLKTLREAAVEGVARQWLDGTPAARQSST